MEKGPLQCAHSSMPWLVNANRDREERQEEGEETREERVGNKSPRISQSLDQPQIQLYF